MMKSLKKTLPPKPWFFPRPVLLLSTRNAQGKDNIITVSWAGVACTTPPMLTVSLRRTRSSHAAVSTSKEFVVNVPTSKQVEAAELCGTLSGKDTDKFATCRLGKLPASVVAAPLIAECPINLECKVRHVLPLGSHDLFVAEIVKTHANHAMLRDDGRIDDTALDCLAWGAEEFLRVLARHNHLRVPRFQ
jgi:flavin reductase (DIM6/NTAB) family NADH-FMN oxidoreductase RutF